MNQWCSPPKQGTQSSGHHAIRISCDANPGIFPGKSSGNREPVFRNCNSGGYPATPPPLFFQIRITPLAWGWGGGPAPPSPLCSRTTPPDHFWVADRFHPYVRSSNGRHGLASAQPGALRTFGEGGYPVTPPPHFFKNDLTPLPWGGGGC